MNVLVVGGAGFVGSHLTERLVAEGNAVEVVDDLTCGSLANLSEARALGGQLQIHTLDAGSEQFQALVQLKTPAVIYHLGLLPPGLPVEATGAASMRSLFGVLEAARETGGVKVVVALSAVALYGEVNAKDQPIKENQPWNPVGVRGVLSRAVAELLAAYREEHAVEFTALAVANLYGARQRPEGGVTAAFAHAIATRSTPTISGDGRQSRDLLFIDDAVDALVRAATKGGGLVVNVGTGVATAVRDLWTLMAGPDAAHPTSVPRRGDEVIRCALSPTRARIHLAWAPWTDLSVGLATMGHRR